jgi:hypothetical protein
MKWRGAPVTVQHGDHIRVAGTSQPGHFSIVGSQSLPRSFKFGNLSESENGRFSNDLDKKRSRQFLEMALWVNDDTRRQRTDER